MPISSRFWRASSLLGTALAVLVALALPTPAQALHGAGACGVVDSPCTLADIAAQALTDSGAEDVVKAGFSHARLPDGTELTLFRVRVRNADGSEATLFYDSEDCSAVLPPEIQVDFLTALATAVETAEAAAPGDDPTTVLSGKLGHELLAPAYRFMLVDPQGGLAGVRVDAVSGEAEILGERDKKGGKGKARGKKNKHGKKKGHFKCDRLDDDDDLEEEDDDESDDDDDLDFDEEEDDDPDFDED